MCMHLYMFVNRHCTMCTYMCTCKCVCASAHTCACMCAGTLGQILLCPMAAEIIYSTQGPCIFSHCPLWVSGPGAYPRLSSVSTGSLKRHILKLFYKVNLFKAPRDVGAGVLSKEATCRMEYLSMCANPSFLAHQPVPGQKGRVAGRTYA